MSACSSCDRFAPASVSNPKQKYGTSYHHAQKKLTANKTATKKRIVHHKDGSIWAKGKMVGKLPAGLLGMVSKKRLDNALWKFQKR
jgi:hypothetical protein